MLLHIDKPLPDRFDKSDSWIVFFEGRQQSQRSGCFAVVLPGSCDEQPWSNDILHQRTEWIGGVAKVMMDHPYRLVELVRLQEKEPHIR